MARPTHTRPIIILALATLLLLPHNSHAARRATIRFVELVHLPGIGLKLKLMSRVKETPLPSPAVYTYMFTRGNTKEKVDMYSPVELWRNSQHAGMWVDQSGNVLTIATISLPMPTGFSREHVELREYEERIRQTRPPTRWASADISKWVDNFTGTVGTKGHAITRKPIKLKNLIEFDIPDNAGRRIAYVFRLNKSASRQSRASTRWYFVQLNTNMEIDTARVQSELHKKFFPSIASVRSTRRDAKSSNYFQTSSTVSEEDMSEEFKRSRALVVSSIHNLKDWWHVETPHYIIISNLRKRYRTMVRELQTDVEYLRTAYEQFIPPRKEITAVSVIRVFATPGEYEAYVPANLRWSGGLWYSPRKELLIKPIDWGGSKAQRDRVLLVTYHEAFHQYIFYALDQVSPAAWFNEGHAVFFESATVEARKLVVNEATENARLVEDIVRADAIDLGTLTRLSYEQFYGNNDLTRQRNYALAWALVYYLRKGAALDKSSPHLNILDSYVDALWQTRDAAAATAKAFAEVDMKVLEHDFVEFWKSRRKRSAAKRVRLFRSPRQMMLDKQTTRRH